MWSPVAFILFLPTAMPVNSRSTFFTIVSYFLFFRLQRSGLWKSQNNMCDSYYYWFCPWNKVRKKPKRWKLKQQKNTNKCKPQILLMPLHIHTKLWFVHLSTGDIWDQIIFCFGALSSALQDIQQHPWASTHQTPVASSSPSFDTKV